MSEDNLNELIERKANVTNELQSLREKIDKEGAKAAVHKLISLRQALKELERQELEIQSSSNSELDAEVRRLEDQIANGYDGQTVSDELDRPLSESVEKIDSAKRELAARSRAVLAVQRQIDDVPSQSELIHLKDLDELGRLQMQLKFQDAITSTDGRMKLINSMEGIIKGSQQKLLKVQLGLKEEQKVCDALKAKHVAATAEQRHCYSLLKAFQEECTKNEVLRRSAT
ncbi:unnamed protein product [Prunus armeniaca]|uniref:CCDC93 coiled-coil domain-containing protein n=1 Tax=Prunus armeniaca TaxID=36596 RepID=A0A6J5TRL5_PRUAR|nr:unnamed protein product [Prunus armeniaca]